MIELIHTESLEGKFWNAWMLMSWDVLVSGRDMQHEEIERQLGIDRHDTLVSGCHNGNGFSARSSWALDANVVDQRDYLNASKQLKQFIEALWTRWHKMPCDLYDRS